MLLTVSKDVSHHLESGVSVRDMTLVYAAVDPVDKTTATYFSRSSLTETSLPTSTLAINLKFSSMAIFANALATVLIFGLSGATLLLTNPHGVSSRSIVSI